MAKTKKAATEAAVEDDIEAAVELEELVEETRDGA